MTKKPILCIILLSLVFLSAGCAESVSEGQPANDTGLPDTTPQVPAPPPEAESTLQQHRMIGAGILVVEEPAENRTITLHHLAEQLESCRFLLESPTNAAWFHYAIWNRTGFVLYEEFPVDREDIDKPFSLQVQLPEDPPYMVQTVFCTTAPTIEFHAREWFYEGVTGEVNISSAERTSFDVHFNSAQAETVGRFNLEYPYFYIEGGPITGMVEPQEGNRYGDWRFYAPGDTGDDWIQRAYHHIDESSWEQQRLVTHAEPGEYRIPIELTTPSIGETRWTISLWTFKFNPVLADHGFELPLRNYVQSE